jgi:hypothetical protein
MTSVNITGALNDFAVHRSGRMFGDWWAVPVM